MLVTEQQVREIVRAAFTAMGPRRFDFYNPNHRPAGDERGGEFAPKGFIDPGEVPAALGELKLRHGMTYNPVGNFTPIKGFAVSIFPDKSTVIEGRDVTEQDIEDYWTTHADILTGDPRAHFGAWVDTSTGKVYLDVTYVEQDRAAAIKLGAKHNQIAIYDLENKVEIPTGGTGEAFAALPATAKRHAGTAQGIHRSGERRASEGRERLKFYWDEGDHPRGRTVPGTNSGSFAPSDGNAGDSGAVVRQAGQSEADKAAVLLDIQQHEAVNVEGDNWNRATALRLEQQYRSAKPALEAIIAEGVASGAETTDAVDPEDAPVVPDDWDMLSSDQQSEVESAWKDSNRDSFYESEVDNWRGEQAEDDARYKVAEDFNDGSETEWATDAIAEWRADREAEGDVIEYTDQEILNALNVEHDTGQYPFHKGTTAELDTEKLGVPGSVNTNQLALEGFEPKQYALTDDQQSSLNDALDRAFEDRASKVQDDLEPPDYLSESVDESMDSYWSDMSDKEKFSYAKDNTSVIEEAQKAYDEFFDGKTVAFTVPDKFDPLSTNANSESYKETQAFAKYVSIERTAQILVERGIESDMEAARAAAKEIDGATWEAWKGSSTSARGWELQVATADELGGRISEHPLAPKTAEGARMSSSYDEVRALVRAKWETTQYMLDKAGANIVEVFRGVDLGKTAAGRELFDAAMQNKVVMKSEMPGSRAFVKLPTLHIERNGAASTTVDRDVANNWGMSKQKITLRAKVPRTAVISVPAYGQNIHSEKEVVVAGTAWKHWDAWAGPAPSYQSTLKEVP